MGTSLAAQRADRILRSAYPDRRQRARAIRWLGWIAYQVNGRRQFTSHDIPARFRDPKFREGRPGKRLASVLAEAADRGVLHGDGPVYLFGDPVLAAGLAALHTASRTGPLWTLISFLARRRHWVRIGADAGACVAIVAVAIAWPLARMPPPWWESSHLAVDLLYVCIVSPMCGVAGAVLLGVNEAMKSLAARRASTRAQRWLMKPVPTVVTMAGLAAWIVGGLAGAITLNRAVLLYRVFQIALISGVFILAVPVLAVAVARSLATGPAWTRTGRLIVMVIVAAAVGGITAGAGLARAVPATFVAACGLLACVLAVRAAGRTRPRWLRNLLTPVPDIVAVATASATILVLSIGNLLTTEPAAGLLFPLAVWGSIKVWRAMSASTPLAARAGADMTLALLLGGGLVVFLVWLANILGMSRPEMAVLRAVLGRAGSAADLPWWLWTGLYILLAGMYAAFLRWPARLAKVTRQFTRLRVVPAATTARRALTCVHIGLLVTVLLGLSTRIALTTTFRQQLKAVYAVAVQREFQAAGELAAYQQIRRQFTADPAISSQPLVTLVTDIYDSTVSPGGNGTENNTENNAAYTARRLGQLQAATLNSGVPRSLLAAEQAAVRNADFGTPIRNASDVVDRIGKIAVAEQNDGETSDMVKQAGELAATAVASTLLVPHLSDNQVIRILREYLSGLVEDSPLRDRFTAWADHLAGAKAPPGAGTLVVPDPERLEQTALRELSDTFTAVGDTAALTAAKNKPPLEAAVDLIDQARPLQPDITTCVACTSPEDIVQQPGEPDIAPGVSGGNDG